MSTRATSVRTQIPLDVWTPEGVEGMKKDAIKNTAKVIKKAARGSLQASMALATFSEQIAARYRREVLSLFLDYLWNAEEKLQDMLSKRPFLASFVLGIFSGIHKLCSWFEGDVLVEQMLFENWENLVRWIKGFCDAFGSKGTPFPGDTSGLTYTEWYARLVWILTAPPLPLDKTRLTQMWEMSIARSALYQLWVHDDPDLDRELVARCSEALSIVLEYGHAQSFPEIDVASELVEKSCIGVEGVARLALSRLTASLKGGDVEKSREFAQIVCAFVNHCDDHPLCMATLEKKAIPLLTKVFVNYARLSLEKEIHVLCRYFMDEFVHSLGYLYTLSPGCPYICQALHNNLLHGIVACTSNLQVFSEEFTKGVNFLLGFVFPTHLVYLTFITALQAAVETLNEKEVENWVLQSSVRSDWICFERCLLERIIYKGLYFKKATSVLRTAMCDQCKKAEDKSKLKLCAGCQGPYYCSKECQLKHWKFGGHREVCKGMSDDMREGLGHREDRKFGAFLVARDVSRHIECLRQMARKEFGGGANTSGLPPYGYSVDYSDYPPKLGVFKIGDKDFGDYDDDSKNLEELREEARLGGQNGEPRLYKFSIHVGKNVVMRTSGNVETRKEPTLESIQSGGFFPSMVLRAPGVDADGKELQVGPDMVDMVLASFPPEVRSGEGLHKYWENGNADSGGAGVGNVTLATKLLQTLNKLYAIASLAGTP
ncbi:hypothetical protein SCHPADRAFT_995099 [Schizopora paradoxa]|uniref:MYND-type domain-containing protein n=1 Tax=Schizopora paradoxa TaxID=27342 RepID=A0A0H2S4B5_9AGAM|nr:hypothetical protein SCHPADRAFT_995099 [Schizopora paradoxa]